MKCRRCNRPGALTSVPLVCGCVEVFCTQCVEQTTMHGEYLSFADWCLGYAREHQRYGGRWVGGHNGRLIERHFEGGTRQTFFLWSYELRRPCGIVQGPPRIYVRPALYQELAMLIGCHYSGGWGQRQEFLRRQFRQRAQRWLRRAA